MSISFIRLAAGSLLALAMPAHAVGGQADASSKIVASNESGGPAAKNEKLICKRFDSTESRMKSIRACYTREQWKKLDDERY